MAGHLMPRSENQSQSPRLLIIEPDDEIRLQMVQALREACEQTDVLREAAEEARGVVCRDCRTEPDDGLCCHLLSSLRELHGFDLSMTDIVICSVSLPDGSGLDALAYVRGLRPELPVVLTGLSGDVDLAVEAIRAGAVDFLAIDGSGFLPLHLAVGKCLAYQSIRRENERLQADLSRSLSELEIKNRQFKSAINQLETMARTDDLTRLANRRWLKLMLEGNWAEATRHGLPLACIMIDLDGFKLLNDECGHQRGDEILRLAGKVIQANSRSVDTSARYGGDEFCILMPHTEAEEAVQVAQRILHEFDCAIGRTPTNGPRVGMSIGVSQIDVSRPVNAAQLLKHADEALYAAKSAGKQQVMLRVRHGVEPAMGVEPKRRMTA